ncbi:MAG: hypothetical protein KC609_02500 [Myxococcales bacterium]|nr:hypothetical protein [Myxococcales bacterium]
MAILHIPDQNRTLETAEAIRGFLAERGVTYERWEASVEFAPDAEQETVLAAYQHRLGPFMERGGYRAADVICIHPELPNLAQLDAKFRQEHTHTEDEIRFFVDGEGYFWFNLGDGDPVFYVKCVAGDMISVPAGSRHWFETGPKRYVKCIRVFTDTSGWTPHYTPDPVHESYSL